ncbi:MAG TPA: short-chain dehydrogenase [Rhodospirillaceae bacterium]|nr:short-chain dehydrogenase [Rhodospirillaceae bacterium]
MCEEVADGIKAAGGKAIVAMADVRDPEQVEAMAAAAAEAFGGIDIVVHNAAVRSNQSFEEMDHETFSHIIDLSVHGCFHLAKAATPSMIARGGGNFIGVGGMTSLKGVKGRSHVMAAKMGLNAFIRGLALDLAHHNIRANQAVVGHYDTVREGNPSSAPQRAATDSGTPLGRKGVPQDMANLIRFLVGPGASYITGQTIHSNGGAYLNL